MKMKNYKNKNGFICIATCKSLVNLHSNIGLSRLFAASTWVTIGDQSLARLNSIKKPGRWYYHIFPEMSGVLQSVEYRSNKLVSNNRGARERNLTFSHVNLVTNNAPSEYFAASLPCLHRKTIQYK